MDEKKRSEIQIATKWAMLESVALGKIWILKLMFLRKWVAKEFLQIK